MKTILVVDDYPIMLEGLVAALTSAGYAVLKASGHNEALDMARGFHGISLFIIDYTLNEHGDGLILRRCLLREGFLQPVIIYAGCRELAKVTELQTLDAEGILLKNDETCELLLAVKRVLEGYSYRSLTLLDFLRASCEAKDSLSDIDMKVLCLISKGHSSREIADRIGLSDKAVDYHRGNILRKMNARNIAEAICRAIRLGVI